MTLEAEWCNIAKPYSQTLLCTLNLHSFNCLTFRDQLDCLMSIQVMALLLVSNDNDNDN